MQPQNPKPIGIKYLLLVFLVYCSTFSLYAQSETLETYINQKLVLINQNLEDKRYDIALTKIEELESYSDYIKLDVNRLKLNLIKAKAYYGIEDTEKAMDLLLNGLDEIESLNQPNLKIEYSNYIAQIFRSSKGYKRSLDYFNISLLSARSIQDTVNLLDSYLSIGGIFFDQEKYDSASYYFEYIIKFPNSVKTLAYIDKSYNNLSAIAVDMGDLNLAEEYGSKSLAIKKEQRDTLGIGFALVNLSGIKFQEKNYKDAKKGYLSALDSIIYLKSSKAVELKEAILYNLSYVYEELGDYKNAYTYLTEATDLTDSLAAAKVARNISELDAKFNVAKEIQKAEEARSASQRAQMMFYGSALTFLLVMALGYFFYRNYRLTQQSKLEQIENETQTKIINATIDAKEKERKSIAETLHDSVSALLSSANLHLQATKSQLKEDAPQEISKAQLIVNEASVKIRDLSHELISSVLLKFGLAFAVHDMCQKYSNSEITLHSDDNGVKRYDQDFEIKIHNIIEELINNILKHSKASNATIMLANRENNMLSIRISDDGVGFNVKTARNKDGLGLSHINARIKVMQGVFNIVSSKDNGTSVFILVPIQHKKIVA